MSTLDRDTLEHRIQVYLNWKGNGSDFKKCRPQ